MPVHTTPKGTVQLPMTEKEADKKIVDADTKVYDFSLGPYAMQSVDTSWQYLNQQFDFDAKIYIAATSSKSSYPKDYQDNDMPGFLECKFE